MSHLSTAQAIYKLLTDDPTLSAKVEGVFDVVPEGQKGPYIQIGELQSLRGGFWTIGSVPGLWICTYGANIRAGERF